MAKLDSQDALVAALSGLISDEERLQKMISLFAEAKSRLKRLVLPGILPQLLALFQRLS